ncbi:2TM domain-containing protein [Paraflavitalea pollutisoli]|uniref:2TM domain-containing protein n=1 Tax=Paraflavitalea pollutisoli TaxID=3034143 RepID=UPI0023EAD407|nr:2TM domain-containing protein [Paraflavitalea sp. H1-2-19X]
MQTDQELRERAHKRVEFRSHLIAYCIVNAMLWLIWYLTGQGYPWPVWPMAGWGIGILFHYIFEYRTSRLLSEVEEYNKLKREMENEVKKENERSAES